MIWSALTSRARLVRKWVWQRTHPSSRVGRAHAVFVVGCQRSGTDMLVDILDASMQTWVYNESDDSPAFDEYRLRAPSRLEALIERSAASAVVFKPICDAHLTDQLLSRHRPGRAVWIYRRYPDVVNSAVAKWGDHQREVIQKIIRGDVEGLGWRAERLNEERVSRVRSAAADDLSDHEGAALFWYLRNSFYFDLGLDERENVLLINYENLVLRPESAFARAFEFLDLPFSPALTSEVFATSVGKEVRPKLRSSIEELCGRMQSRLDESSPEDAVGREAASSF